MNMRETMVFLIQICFQRQVCAIIHYQDGVSNSMLVLLADDVRRVATQRKGTFGFNYRSRDVLQIRATFCGCSQDPFSLRRRWISCQIGESGVLLQRSGSCVGGAFVAFPPAFQTHAFQSPNCKTTKTDAVNLLDVVALRAVGPNIFKTSVLITFPPRGHFVQ